MTLVSFLEAFLGKYPIKYVSQKTGLSTQLIRVWENRYQAIAPARTETNRRLYSDDDIYKLKLLKQISDQGHSIGQIAGLTIQELESYVEPQNTNASPIVVEHQSAHLDSQMIEKAIHLVMEMKHAELDALLIQVATQVGYQKVVDELILPLMQEVGDRWYNDELSVAHEHLTTSVVRSFLDHVKRNFSIPRDAPKILVACPSNQHHELGALAVACASASVGWEPLFFGTNTPLSDLAAASLDAHVSAVALSYAVAGPQQIHDQLTNFLQLLPQNFPVYVGGRAVTEDVKIPQPVLRIKNIQELRETLLKSQS